MGEGQRWDSWATKGGEEEKSVKATGFFSFLPELDPLSLDERTSHTCCRGGSVEKGLEGKNRSSQKRISVRGQNLCSQTRMTNPLSHM